MRASVQNILCGALIVLVGTGVAYGQTGCLTGKVMLALGANGAIKVCPEYDAKAPNLQKQIDVIEKDQADNGALLHELARSARGLNALGRNVDGPRQVELLRNFANQLQQSSHADQAKTQRQISELADKLDSLTDLIVQKKEDTGTAVQTQVALQGSLGDSIAKLDLKRAESQLDAIQARLDVIDTRVQKTEANTEDIKNTLEDLRTDPLRIRDALATADLRTLNSLDLTRIKPSVVEELLGEKSSDGKQSVARKFFESSLDAPNAIDWFNRALKAGLNPNLTIATSSYSKEAIINEALRARNVAAVMALLDNGASPHGYQDLFLTPYANVRFLFPLASVTQDEGLTQKQKQTLADAFFRAGVVLPQVAPEHNGYQDVMYAAKKSNESATSSLGIRLPQSPTLCEQASTPICKAASKRTGEDWCGIIARLPKKLQYILDQGMTPVTDIELKYLLAIENDKAYFLGFTEGSGPDYVLVEVSMDGSSWTVLHFMEPAAGMGLCSKSDDGFQPDRCWRKIAMHRIEAKDGMEWDGWHLSWRIIHNACSGSEKTGAQSLVDKSPLPQTKALASQASPRAMQTNSIPGQPGGTSQQQFTTEIGGSLVGKRYRTNLLILRDHPDIIDEFSQELSRWLLYIEPGERKEVADITQSPPEIASFNTGHPAFALEWPDLLRTDPKLANGAAVDVYIRPDADWSFLKKQPGWRDDEEAWVGMFLFPKSAEVGRDTTFAAHEVAPLMKQQLEAAARRESPDLWFQVELKPVDYDMDAKALQFKTEDLVERNRLGSGIANADSLFGYSVFKLQERLPIEIQRRIGGYRKSFAALSRWREMIGFKASADTLALDRQLRITTIPVDIKTAERLRLRAGSILQARIFVHVQGSAKTATSTDRYVLFATLKKVELLTNSGDVVASIPGSDFPKARSIVEK